jgi:hypothetical protein
VSEFTLFNGAAKIIRAGLSTTGLLLVQKVGIGIVKLLIILLENLMLLLIKLIFLNKKIKFFLNNHFINNDLNQKIFYFFIMYFLGFRSIYLYDQDALFCAFFILLILFLSSKALITVLEPTMLNLVKYIYLLYLVTFLVTTNQLKGFGLFLIMVYGIVILFLITKPNPQTDFIEHHFDKEFIFFSELKKAIKLMLLFLPGVKQFLSFFLDNILLYKIVPLIFFFMMLHFFVFYLIQLVIYYSANPITNNVITGCKICVGVGCTYLSIINVTGLLPFFPPLGLPGESALQQYAFGLKLPTHGGKNVYHNTALAYPSQIDNIPRDSNNVIKVEDAEIFLKRLVLSDVREMGAEFSRGIVKGVFSTSNPKDVDLSEKKK